MLTAFIFVWLAGIRSNSQIWVVPVCASRASWDVVSGGIGLWVLHDAHLADWHAVWLRNKRAASVPKVADSHV
jgi:hypothetical protein